MTVLCEALWWLFCEIFFFEMFLSKVRKKGRSCSHFVWVVVNLGQHAQQKRLYRVAVSITYFICTEGGGRYRECVHTYIVYYIIYDSPLWSFMMIILWDFFWNSPWLSKVRKNKLAALILGGSKQTLVIMWSCHQCIGWQ